MITEPLTFDAEQALGIDYDAQRGNGRHPDSKRTRRASVPTELPLPPEGYVAIRVPRGLTLQQVCGSELGRELLEQQQWYVNKPWYTAPLPGGIWLFRCLNDSRGLRTCEVRALMNEKEDFPHVALATAFVLLLRKQGIDPLANVFLTVCCDSSESVIQLGTRGKRVILLTHADRHDKLSMASAAMLMK